jgi:hypothetical protein
VRFLVVPNSTTAHFRPADTGVYDVLNLIGTAKRVLGLILLRRHGEHRNLVAVAFGGGVTLRYEVFPVGSSVMLEVDDERSASVRNLDIFEVLEELARRDLTPSLSDARTTRKEDHHENE